MNPVVSKISYRYSKFDWLCHHVYTRLDILNAREHALVVDRARRQTDRRTEHNTVSHNSTTDSNSQSENSSSTAEPITEQHSYQHSQSQDDTLPAQPITEQHRYSQRLRVNGEFLRVAGRGEDDIAPVIFKPKVNIINAKVNFELSPR